MGKCWLFIEKLKTNTLDSATITSSMKKIIKK